VKRYMIINLFIRKLTVAAVIAVLFLLISEGARASVSLIQYVNETLGFSFQYPENWVLVDDVEKILSIQDGTVNLIREEEYTSEERNSYKVMVHVDGSPRYLSNVVVKVKPHQSSTGRPFASSEDALQALKEEFERARASGIFFLEEIYLGESHTFVYRRNVKVPQWEDTIRVTYYLAASRTHAYILVESVLLSALGNSVYRDGFNQLVQSFRVLANETQPIDPSLDWGASKPGAGVEGVPSEDMALGRIEIREDFLDNSRGWPVNEAARLIGGRYELSSSQGPFTVTNIGMGQIGFDFSYEGEFEFISGDETAGYGLVFAYTDEDNYYAFLVTQKGQFLVVRESLGKIENLIDWTFTPRLTGKKHRLMVQGGIIKQSLIHSLLIGTALCSTLMVKRLEGQK